MDTTAKIKYPQLKEMGKTKIKYPQLKSNIHISKKAPKSYPNF